MTMRGVFLAVLCTFATASACADYDVIIYGATPAGFAAAVEVGRRGASAVVLEPRCRIGGLTTSGLGQTDSGNVTAYGGIAIEFYRAVRAHSIYIIVFLHIIVNLEEGLLKIPAENRAVVEQTMQQ